MKIKFRKFYDDNPIDKGIKIEDKEKVLEYDEKKGMVKITGYTKIQDIIDENENTNYKNQLQIDANGNIVFLGNQKEGSFADTTIMPKTLAEMDKQINILKKMKKELKANKKTEATAAAKAAADAPTKETKEDAKK